MTMIDTLAESSDHVKNREYWKHIPKVTESDCKEISELDFDRHNSGIVLFRNVIDLDLDTLMPYVDSLESRMPVMPKLQGTEENIRRVNEQPIRMGSNANLMDASTPPEVAKMFLDMEDALYKCLIRYIDMYPMILNTLWWRNRGHVMKYLTDGLLGTHNDNDSQYRVIDGVRYITDQPLSVGMVCTGIIYFNDDYEGGETDFPYEKIKITPEPGSILFFPCNYVGSHAVRPVLSGTRYSYLSNFGQGDGRGSMAAGHPEFEITDADDLDSWCPPHYLPWIYQDYERYYNSGHSEYGSEQWRHDTDHQGQMISRHPIGQNSMPLSSDHAQGSHMPYI